MHRLEQIRALGFFENKPANAPRQGQKTVQVPRSTGSFRAHLHSNQSSIRPN